MLVSYVTIFLLGVFCGMYIANRRVRQGSNSSIGWVYTQTRRLVKKLQERPAVREKEERHSNNN